MGAELPDRRAAHGETTDEESVVVDVVALAGMGVRLPEVDLTGHLVGAAVTAVEMEHQAVVRRELTDILAAVAEEGEFGQSLAATVAPEVEAHQRTRIVVRDDHAVRLDRAVDLRLVATDDQAGLAGPRGLTFEERGGTGLALDDQIVGGLEFALIEILIVATRPVDGLVEDLDVRQELLEARILRLSLGGGVDGRA